MNRRALLAIAAAGLTAPVVARAQQGSSAVAKANANVVGVISGGLDGTYTRFAADLAAVLDDIDGLRIVPMIGKGSFQNLSDLLYMRGVDVAIVQSDVLAAARRKGRPAGNLGEPARRRAAADLAAFPAGLYRAVRRSASTKRSASSSSL